MSLKKKVVNISFAEERIKIPANLLTTKEKQANREKYNANLLRKFQTSPPFHVRTASGEELTYSFNNFELTGNGPYFLEFEIYVSCNVGTTYLDNAPIYIEYNSAAFGTNVVANNKVSVTPGLGFNTPTYSDPNSLLGDDSPNVFSTVMSLDYNQNSWNRTNITTIGDVLLNVKMEIANCGIKSGINFTNQATSLNALIFTTNPIEDAFSGQFYFYSDLLFSGNLDVDLCTPQIIYFDPGVVGAGAWYTGGPFGNSLLTIEGTGFGDQVGQVIFKGVTNSNGGEAGSNHWDIASWTNKKIEIHVPYFTDSFPSPASPTGYPGSGTFKVKNALGYSGASPWELGIKYAIGQNRNPTDPLTKIRTDLINMNGTGGYTIHLDTSITNNPNPMFEAIIRKAVKDWRCATLVNWEIGTDTTLGFLAGSDKITTISLTTAPLGTSLAITSSHTLICNDGSGTGYAGYMREWDMKISKDLTNHTGGGAWFFDTLGNDKPNGTFDFYNVILHELGHAHSLKHIIGPSLMKVDTDKTFVAGPSRLTIKNPAQSGGEEVILKSQSTLYANCTEPSAIIPVANDSCIYVSRSKGITTLKSIRVFPNPISSRVFIEFRLTKPQITEISIFDFYGRKVLGLGSFLKPSGQNIDFIDIPTLSPGIYFITLEIEGIKHSEKIVKF